MKRNNSPWQPLQTAVLEWAENETPRSTRFNDFYYSSEDGLSESEYVFLQSSKLPERWLTHPFGSFNVAETGFGSGLNFLLTWQAWRNSPLPRPRLYYLSMEKFPLSEKDLRRALKAWPSLTELSDELLQSYPPPLPGQHRIMLERGQVILDLCFEDATEALVDLASYGKNWIDAWYLDGFSPAANTSMWSPELFSSMTTLSRDKASVATFTAASHVRRALSQAGFSVQRVNGFGLKRECLRAILDSVKEHSGYRGTPWDLSAGSPTGVPSRALVLGGGLAGCTVAAALAQRGIAVTLLEQSHIAGAGSGNDQAVLYTRLSRQHSALTDIALLSFCFATRFYQRLFDNEQLKPGLDGDLCGSFQQSENSAEMAALAAPLHAIPSLARLLSANEANEILGIEQHKAGYWFPGSGWLHPGAVCRTLLNHPLIEVREELGEIQLSKVGECWRATNRSGLLEEAEVAVIATGTSSTKFAPLKWLPVQAIRGQTSSLNSTQNLSSLRAALCHTGYIAPQRQGQHCMGASFNLNDNNTKLSEHDHRSNISALAQAVPNWQAELAALDCSSLEGRVGFRCASPDYLPMAGPVPHHDAFVETFSDLRKNAKLDISHPGPYMNGLYVSTGHGSRGLTSTPLCAELIAGQICGEPPPVSREFTRALAPARFIIRDLKRNRI